MKRLPEFLSRCLLFNRKKSIQKLVIILLVIALGGIGLVNAQELPKSWTSLTQAPQSNEGYMPPDMQLEGTEVTITLDQAIQLAINQGTLAKSAVINRKLGQAKADAYYETFNILSADGSSAGVNARKLAELTANFADGQTDRNYTAEINALKRDAVKKYFETVQARDVVKLSLDNVTAQETIAQNNQKKYDQGLMTKLDLLEVQASVDQAKSDLMAVQNAHVLSVMSLNRALGYPLMQNTVPTDALVVSEPVFPSLSDTIAAGKSYRNEILGADFAVQAAKYSWRDAEDTYGDDSPQALQARAAYDVAEKAANDLLEQIEMDVRSKFLQVKAAQVSADASEASLQQATEATRVARLSYENGLITESDLQMALLGVYQSELQYSKKLLTFKLAIKDYELSYSEGVYLVSF